MVLFYKRPVPPSQIIWAYAIGCFDLIAALLFAVVSLRTICQRVSWLTIFATLFGIFWVSMIVMLLVGIHGRKPRFVRVWIIFSCAGILAEICLILFATFSDNSIQKGLVRNGILLMAGLIVEFIFLFIVHRFYVTVSYCEACPNVTAQETETQQTNFPPSSYSASPYSSPYFRSIDHTSANPMKLSWHRSFDRHTVP